jgi:hypothetical protein
MACGGGGSHSNTIATAGGNVQAISVNSGPDGNYTNGAFTSVTVCVPGTSTCQTNGNFITTYKGPSYNSSTTGIPVCPDAKFYYCPSTTVNLSASNQGTNGASGTVNFSVANADNLFRNNPGASVLVGLAGANSQSGFDWGLPLFFGRNLFTAVEGRSTPGEPGPYWAY